MYREFIVFLICRVKNVLFPSILIGKQNMSFILENIRIKLADKALLLVNTAPDAT
jgi:hypothetical protein